MSWQRIGEPLVVALLTMRHQAHAAAVAGALAGETRPEDAAALTEQLVEAERPVTALTEAVTSTAAIAWAEEVRHALDGIALDRRGRWLAGRPHGGWRLAADPAGRPLDPLAVPRNRAHLVRRLAYSALGVIGVLQYG